MKLAMNDFDIVLVTTLVSTRDKLRRLGILMRAEGDAWRVDGYD